MTALASVFLPLLVAYGGTLRWIWDSWIWRDSYYQHGVLLPLVAALWLWHGRRTWSAVAAAPRAMGWALLAPGLLLHLAGAALMIDSLSAASLLLSVPGATWLALGAARLRSVLPMLGLLVFAIPLPIFVTGRLAFELKEVAVEWGVALAQAFGVAVERRSDGLYVPPNSMPLVVAPACSGLRSLLSLITLGYCVAFCLVPPRGARPWLVLAAAVPIALATNLLRIAGVCVLARSHGVDVAAGTGHDLLNAAAWLVDLALLLALHVGLRRFGGPR